MRCETAKPTKGNSKVTGGAEKHPSTSRATAITKPEARSRVSNGKNVFLEGVDGRTLLARRYRDILAQLTSDLGGDPSEAQSIIIRRATQLAVWCERAEAEAAAGSELDLTKYCTATNSLHRLLTTLGLERRMKDITPSISAYLNGGSA